MIVPRPPILFPANIAVEPVYNAPDTTGRQQSLILPIVTSRMRLRNLSALPLLSVFLGGCFIAQPVDRLTPKVGTDVVLQVNDVGRRALAPTMGDAIDEIHGRLTARDSDSYIVSVNSVDFLHADPQNWSGALARVNSDYVDRYYSVQLSTGRTLAFVGAVAAGTGILIGALASSGSGSGASGNTGDNTPPIQRVPPRIHIPLNSRVVTAITRLLPHFAW
jgi:hypothetical protein